MYGKEDFTSLLAGVGSKPVATLWQFKEGKYILPNNVLSYTLCKHLRFHTGFGRIVRISTESAHSIQLNPSIRFITNTKNRLAALCKRGYGVERMNENKVTANDVRLRDGA